MDDEKLREVFSKYGKWLMLFFSLFVFYLVIFLFGSSWSFSLKPSVFTRICHEYPCHDGRQRKIPRFWVCWFREARGRTEGKDKNLVLGFSIERLLKIQWKVDLCSTCFNCRRWMRWTGRNWTANWSMSVEHRRKLSDRQNWNAGSSKWNRIAWPATRWRWCSVLTWQNWNKILIHNTGLKASVLLTCLHAAAVSNSVLSVWWVALAKMAATVTVVHGPHFSAL